MSSHAHPTFIVPPDHVVKLYAPWEDGPAMVAAERAAFDWLRRDPDLPVPALVAQGPLATDHAYLAMTRLRGRPLDELRAELSVDALVPVLAWAGRTLRRIHAIALTAAERDAGREAFLGFAWELRRSAVADPEALLGLPAHLASQLDAWLPDPQTLTGPAQGLTVIHGDLQYRHLLVERDDAGTVRPTGIIDVNRMRVGRPILDLGPLWADLGPEPDALRAAFLEAAAIPGSTIAGARRDALAWALLQRRRWTYLVPGHEAVPTLDALADLVFADLGVGAP